MAAVPKLQPRHRAAPRAAPAPTRLWRNVAALLMLGLCVGAYLTAQVRLAVLEAEKRQLLRELGDARAENTMLLKQARLACAPARLARAADERGLRPPAGMDTVHPASLRLEQPAQGSARPGLYAFARRLAARLGLVSHVSREAAVAEADRPS